MNAERQVWLVIPWDAQPVLRRTDGGLQAMKDVVQGWIEAIRREDGVLWCNEEYALHAQFAGQVNMLATRLVPPHYSMSLGGLLGNCLVTGVPDAEGDTTSVDPALVRFVNRETGWRVLGLDEQPLDRWWPYPTELAEFQATQTVGAMIGRTPVPEPGDWI